MKLTTGVSIALGVILAQSSLAGEARSEDGDASTVDLELILAVDISRSMDFGEQVIQRRGYVEAFRSAEVVDAITGGLWGRIAVTYVEWSGYGSADAVVPWTLITDLASADRFASELETHEPLRISRTSISGALEYSQSLFGTGGWHGLRKVIDVSGDGPNNHGKPIKPISEEVAQNGITINGLPLMVRTSSYGYGIDNLDEYYYDCVIGGPGAFMLPVYSWEEFPSAVRRKLVLEISANPDSSMLFNAASDSEMPTNCMIGETMWQQRMRDLEWK
jgi:Protein of unknown function (DUF1194)